MEIPSILTYVIGVAGEEGQEKLTEYILRPLSQ